MLSIGVIVFTPQSDARNDGTRRTEDHDVIADTPIENPEDDLLGRSLFVEQMKAEILGFKLPDNYVYLLSGEWGEGKTSVINLLERKLDDDAIYVRFEPWAYTAPQTLLAAFYDELIAQLHERYFIPQLRGFVKQYLKLSSVQASASFFDFSISTDETNLNESRYAIQRVISTLKKRLVVVIDDLDRLDISELLEVLKLVRVHANFQHVTFILVGDVKRLTWELGKMADQSDAVERSRYGMEFLEKFVQKFVPLPKAEPGLIDKYLFLSDHGIPSHTVSDLASSNNDAPLEISVSGYLIVQEGSLNIRQTPRASVSLPIHLDASISAPIQDLSGKEIFVKGLYQNGQISISRMAGEIRLFRLSAIDRLLRRLKSQGLLTDARISEFDREFTQTYRTRLSKGLRTLRHAKRYLNGILASLPTVIHEVDLSDFFALEFIKVFYPAIYTDIFDNWWIYVEQRGALGIEFTPLFMEDNKEKLCSEHVNKLLAKITNDEAEKENLRDLLGELFSRRYRGEE